MKQKHTLIVGGTHGLGKIVVRMLHEEGNNVSVLGRSLPLQDSQSIKDAFYVQADLLDEKSFTSALLKVTQERGKIHNLIFLQRFRGEGDYWKGELEVSLNATRKIIEHIKHDFVVGMQNCSSIVIVSSIIAEFSSNSQPLSYSIAKAGLNCIMRYYTAVLGPCGIRVNTVSPITFVKEESKKYYYEENQELNKLYKKIIPLGRMCTSEDVANVIVFLCSDKASFISGQNIIIDGGLSILSHESLVRDLMNI